MQTAVAQVKPGREKVQHRPKLKVLISILVERSSILSHCIIVSPMAQQKGGRINNRRQDNRKWVHRPDKHARPVDRKVHCVHAGSAVSLIPLPPADIM